MQDLKIDDVAKQSGLTKRTIRYYEEIGLLPAPPRTEGGVRLYTQEHVEFLKKITNARDVLGFTLQELQHFITLSDAIQTRRADYKTANRLERKQKLEEVIELVEQQLRLIDIKLHRTVLVQNELAELRERARKALSKIDEEQ